MFKPHVLAAGIVVLGAAIEVFMSLGVVNGVGDRACALVGVARIPGPTARVQPPVCSKGEPVSNVSKDQSSDHDDGGAAGPKPLVPYWHLYVDADGVSRQRQCHLTDYELSGVGPADPQWNDRQATHPSTVVFTVQPVGWVGDWHQNPAPQWIVVLSGRWFIESMDGVRVEQGPGEFSFGEDQGCTETGGRRGHRSGTLGDAPAVLMTVQLHRPPQRDPCHTT